MNTLGDEELLCQRCIDSLFYGRWVANIGCHSKALSTCLLSELFGGFLQSGKRSVAVRIKPACQLHTPTANADPLQGDWYLLTMTASQPKVINALVIPLQMPLPPPGANKSCWE